MKQLFLILMLLSTSVSAELFRFRSGGKVFRYTYVTNVSPYTYMIPNGCAFYSDWSMPSVMPLYDMSGNSRNSDATYGTEVLRSVAGTNVYGRVAYCKDTGTGSEVPDYYRISGTNWWDSTVTSIVFVAVVKLPTLQFDVDVAYGLLGSKYASSGCYGLSWYTNTAASMAVSNIAVSSGTASNKWVHLVGQAYYITNNLYYELWANGTKRISSVLVSTKTNFDIGATNLFIAVDPYAFVTRTFPGQISFAGMWTNSTWTTNMILDSYAALMPTNYLAVIPPVSGNGWAYKAKQPFALRGSAGAALNGKIYVVGGASQTVAFTNVAFTNTVYCYDTTNDIWTTLASYPINVVDASAAGMGGNLYCAGGWVGATTYGCTNAYVYSPTSNTWTTIIGLPESRGDGQLQCVSNAIYYIGGFTAEAAGRTNVYVYTAGTNSWGQRAGLPITMDGGCSAVSSNYIYVCGGVNRATGVYTNGFYRYDTIANVWSNMVGPPVSGYKRMGAILDRSFWYMGGSQAYPFNTRNSIWVYSLDSNMWSAVTSGYELPSRRQESVAVTVNSNIYVAGGAVAVYATYYQFFTNMVSYGLWSNTP